MAAPPADVRELHARGRTAWPDVDLALDAFAAHLATKLALSSSDEVDAVRADGIYIAAACANGIEAAARALRSRYQGRIIAALMRVGSNDAEEILQRVYERVLVGSRRGQPDIAKYDGRGDLGAWLVTVAVREAYRAARAERRDSGDDVDLETAVERSDQELAYLKSHYRERFKAAFRAALGDLEGRERNLLRYQYLHELTYEQIAAIYGVGRATAARWLAGAKTHALRRTRAHLKETLDCAELELDSVMKLVESQLDVTLTRLMATTAHPDE